MTGHGNHDAQIRMAAFAFLDAQIALHGDVLPRSILERGFDFEGVRVPLIAPQGIFKPKILDLPLTITTAPPKAHGVRPYEDELGEDGVMRYRYRGTDPNHPDNVGLRKVMEQGLPMIYLFGIVPGQYLPVYPVYITGDDPKSLSVYLQVDEAKSLNPAEWSAATTGESDKRRYITVQHQQRLHQRSFRDRVLRAYQSKCAVCRLKHVELLEGAHIIPDGKPLGDPIIPNGMALCKLHHAAFDLNIIGVSPDLVIDVRQDILEEHDGPMLRHGLQEMQGVEIHVPRSADFRPDRERLDIRYQEFRNAG